jgi:hypothetical protein
MMDGNNNLNQESRKVPMKTRGIVLKCSDETYLDIQRIIRDLPDCYMVFSKSSNLKLIIKEEGL